MGGENLVAADGDDETLDEVFQLADVAGPGVLLEGGECGVVDVLDGDAVGDAVSLEEVLAEQRDVAGAIAQGWELDGDDVDAVVEVFAEAAGAGHLLEIFVGGADEAEVDFAERSTAEALHHVVFKDAEELGLEG